MKRILSILFLFAAFGVAAQTASPFDYGLREAHGPMGCYYVLYNTHVDALKRGLEVSYDGIDTLWIELPPDWKSIPLGHHTDFGGLVLYVKNNTKHGALFSLGNKATDLEIDKNVVDGLDYRGIPVLAEGW